MASGLLSLKWNHHRSTFLHVLATIRQKESYSDVTLACAGKFYSAHKLVLSTCSEYFEEMFERTQCKHPVIVLKDIGSEELEALLSYMYDGEVNVLQENLSSLIKAAECLKIKGLAVADHDPSEQSKDKSSSSSKDVNRSHSSNSNYHSDSNNSNSNRQFRNNSGGGLKRPIVNKQEDTQPLKRRRPADPVHSSPVRRTSTDKSIISNNKDRSSSSKAGDGESSQPAAGGGGGSEAGDENNSMDDPGGADDQASSDVPDDASRSFAQGLSEDTGVKAEPVEILDSDDMGYDQHADAGASHDASDHEFTEEKFSGGAGGSDAGGGDPNSLWGGGDPADLFSQPSTSSFTGQEGSNTENTSNGGSKAGGSSTGPVLFGDTVLNNSWLGIGCEDLQRQHSSSLLSNSSNTTAAPTITTAATHQRVSHIAKDGSDISDNNPSSLSVGRSSANVKESSSSSLMSSFISNNPNLTVTTAAKTTTVTTIDADDEDYLQHHHDESTSSSVTEFLGSLTQDFLEVSFAPAGSNSNSEEPTLSSLYNNFQQQQIRPHLLYPLQQQDYHHQQQRDASVAVADLFNCQQCPFTTSRSSQFRAHMRSHTGEKLHACPHCPYKTDIRCHLQRHIRKHTGERPYTCNVCGKSFFNSDYLIIHTRIHTGEKPFSCQFCDYRSTQKSHMKAHVANKHSDRYS